MRLLRSCILVLSLRLLTASVKPRVVVVGGGVGGLFAAAKLAKLGHDVTLCEQNSVCGGRLGSEYLLDGSYRFDIGPSLMLLPNVYRDAFQQLDEDLENHVGTLEIHDPQYRVFFEDNPSFGVDICRDERKMEASFELLVKGSGSLLFECYKSYLKVAGGFLDFGWPAVIEERLFAPDSLLRLPSFLSSSLTTFPLVSHVSMLREFFGPSGISEKDLAKVIALLSFQNLYIGLSPSDTPAVFSLLQALEFEKGIFYPKCGFAGIANALTSISTKLGVKIRTNCRVKGLVQLSDGTVRLETERDGEIVSDRVILNVDLPEAEETLVDETSRDTVGELRPSCAIVQLHFALSKKLDALAHHSLFLSSAPEKQSWATIHSPNSASWDPTAFNFYVHAPSRTDPTCCPLGHDALTILVPVPPLTVRSSSKRRPSTEEQAELVSRVRNAVLKRLEPACGEDISAFLVAERSREALSWNAAYGLFRGQAFGLSHNLRQLSLLRPGIIHPKLSSVFRAGASTRPGNGVPLCLVSGRLAAEAVQASLGPR